MKWNSDPNRYGKSRRDQQIKDNREYYEERKCAGVTLEECVDDALITGNHAMFAQKFIHDTALKSTERFCAWCEALRKDNKIPLTKLQFVSTNDWRNPAISPDAMKDMSSSSKSNWQTGTTAIPRDNLIQLALYLGMSSGEADDLLFFMNKRRFYPLDVVDAVMMYYLDYFCTANSADKTKNLMNPETVENEETQVSPKQPEKPDIADYKDKLRKVKAEINEALTALDQQGLVWMRTPKNNQSKKTKNNPDAAYNYMPTFRSELGINIIKELSVLKKVYEKNMDLSEAGASNEPTLTMFMTQYFRKRMEHAGSFSEYFDLEKFSEHPVFTERYYGYLKRTLDYLYDWRMYRKNFMTSGWILTDHVRYYEAMDLQKKFLDPAVGDIFESFRSFKEGMSCPADGCLDSDNAETSFRDECYETCFKLVHGIETLDVIIQDDPAYSIKKRKKVKWTVSRKYLEGEKVPGSAVAVKWVPTGDGAFAANQIDAEDSVTGFTAKEMKNKKAIMEYAIATGHEDDLGNYLCLAGYWKTDWYVEDGREAFAPDRLDALFLYAMDYRDKLIDSVCSKSGRGVDQTVRRDQLRSGFPMRELLTIISRDISYAYTVCETDIYKREEDTDHALSKNAGSKESKSLGTGFLYEEKFAEMRDNMLFPIAWTTKEHEYNNDREANPYFRRKKTKAATQ